jgi:hypothetical protein
VYRFGGIGFDLGPQASYVDVHESSVTEVVITPDVLEEVLARQDSPSCVVEFHDESKLR